MEAAEVLAEAIERAAARHEVAMNDHAVGLMKALEALPTTDTAWVSNALLDVARAIDNLAEAVREGHRTPPG